MKAIINKIIPFSSVDGPGNRTVVFLQGCNMNCLYCHNPETINVCNNCGFCVKECPVDALAMHDNKVVWDRDRCVGCDKCIKFCPNSATPKVESLSTDDLLNIILKYKSFISGVTFSGGECTIQSDFIFEIVNELKQQGLTTFIDTNGLIDLSTKQEFVDLVDSFMLDIKAWNNDEHYKLTNADNKVVIKNLKYLIEQNKLFEVRTVIVPNLFNNEKTVNEVSKLIATKGIRYKLIKFRAKGVRGVLEESASPSDAVMNKLKNIAQSNGVEDIVII